MEHVQDLMHVLVVLDIINQNVKHGIAMALTIQIQWFVLEVEHVLLLINVFVRVDIQGHIVQILAVMVRFCITTF